jgi:WD40 repeat protein
MDITKDSKYMYSGAQTDGVKSPLIKWDIRRGKAIKKWGPVHSDHVIALKLSLDDKFLYTGGHTTDPALRVWNLINETLLMEILDTCWSVRCLYLTIDGLSLFVSEDNGDLKSFDVEEDGRLKKVREHKTISSGAMWWIQGPHS